MSMKRINVADATRLQLNWLVAQCQGAESIRFDGQFFRVYFGGSEDYLGNLNYSVDWALMGPILDECDWLLPYHSPSHRLHLGAYSSKTPSGFEYSGPTPLIAVARAYVASNLGDVVELPECLVSPPTPAEGVPQDSAWQPEPVTGYGPKLVPQVSGFDLAEGAKP